MVQGFRGPSGYKPWRARMSAKFRPEALTRTRTSPLAGTGSGRVSTFIKSTPPLRVVTTALIKTGVSSFQIMPGARRRRAPANGREHGYPQLQLFNLVPPLLSVACLAAGRCED